MEPCSLLAKGAQAVATGSQRTVDSDRRSAMGHASGMVDEAAQLAKTDGGAQNAFQNDGAGAGCIAGKALAPPRMWNGPRWSRWIMAVGLAMGKHNGIRPSSVHPFRRAMNGHHVVLGLGMVWLFTCSAPNWAQSEGWTQELPEFFSAHPELVWGLQRASEMGECTSRCAALVMAHVRRQGPPWSVEEAHLVEGLTPLEHSWLAQAPWWRAAAMDRVRRASQPTPSWRSTLATTLARTDQDVWTMVPAWRVTAPHVMAQVVRFAKLQASGAVHGGKGGVQWVLGDHRLGWGQGLTIPRNDPFGQPWFLGASEVMLHAAPWPLRAPQGTGTFRGVAAELGGSRFHMGCSKGQDHTSLMLGFAKTKDRRWGASLHQAPEVLKYGLDGSGELGAWSHQWAVAAVKSSGQTSWSRRASMRRAWGNGAVVQCAHEAFGSSGWRAYERETKCHWASTHGPQGLRLQWRLSLQNGGSPEVRTRVVPSKTSPWTWDLRLDEGISTFTGTWHDGHWRLSWMVTPWQGTRGQGRAVTWQSGWQQGQWRVGAMAMDGEGSPVTGYVSIAWLESRRWVRLPEDGARLSLWFEQKTNRLGRKGSWSGHLFWSPSQQETFRCGLRWSWEA